MVTVKLEFSEDDLSVSNAAATWVDVTDLLKAGTLRISGGIDRLGDPPRAGEMSFTLLGTDFVPLNEDSPYYPNVVRRRRFRYSVLRGATYESRFLGYARTFQPVWPGNVTHQEVEVVCGDGFDILSTDRFEALDPASATSYEEVVMHDEPFAYYRLGESAGTKAEPVTGPEGVYKATPTLGQQPLIVGEAGTSVRFASASSERMEAVVDSGKFADTNQFTLEAVVRGVEDMIDANGWAIGFASGAGLGKGDGGFWTGTANAGTIEGTTGYNEDETRHLSLTWTGQLLSLYVDGVLEATSDSAPVTQVGGTTIYVGRGAAAEFFGGHVQHAVFYEHALTAERVAAHHAAYLAGFAQQTAGERIAAAATHALWSGARIDAGAFRVRPVMKHGQSPLDVITDAAEAEGLRTLFFFDGDGDPVYRGWEWQAETAYSTVQETFGAPPGSGELAFDGQDLRFDDEVYNSVTKGRVGGVAHTETDAASEALIGPSVAEPVSDLILADDADVPKLCGEHLTLYRDPSYALDTLTLHGSDEDQLEAILDLEIGDMIRYKRRSHHEDGSLADPIDVITWVLGFDETLEAGSVPVRTLRLARGINGAQSVWRAGLVGFSEADSTTVAA